MRIDCPPGDVHYRSLSACVLGSALRSPEGGEQSTTARFQAVAEAQQL